jgi:hypothetical protein
MFRVVISFMTKIERMKKYSINFKIKDYFNKEHAKVEETTKRRDSKIELYHYIVICQIFQLHDEKRERKEFRKNLLDVFTIKTNEILNEVCVVQSKSRDKRRDEKTIKTSKERSNRLTTKIAKNELQLTTKIAKNQSQFITSETEEIREKRRNSKDDSQSHNKRHKRDKNDEVIDLKNEKFDVASRKTRSQIRRKILKKLKNVINASNENDQTVIAKNSTMFDVLQDSITSISKSKKFVSTSKKIVAVVVKTSKSNRELKIYNFINEKEKQSKTKLKLMNTAIETYQRIF